MTKLIISLLVSLSCVSSALAIDTSIERTPKQSFVPSITPALSGAPGANKYLQSNGISVPGVTGKTIDWTVTSGI